MKSPVGSESLAACNMVGCPAAAIPSNALSTKPGPYSLLKIWTQALPHWVVDAPAGSAAAVPRPPATVSVAAAASTLVLMDMTVPFVKPQPCPAHGGFAGTRLRPWPARRPRPRAAGARHHAYRRLFAATGQPRYGARNAVSAAATSSGASSRQ